MTHFAADQASLARKASGIFGRFRVQDWAAVGLGLETRDQWHDWARSGGRGATSVAAPSSLPLLLRRRVTPIGQMALRAAHPLAGGHTRYVFCSRHGEYQRTLGLLKSIARQEESSPAEFSLSVHNALAGLLSIATGNRGGHTAIAAGEDSFGFGLVEALGCLVERPDEAVMLVYFDEPLPAPYDELPETHDAAGIALALSLAAANLTQGNLLLSAEPRSGACAHSSSRSQALDFIAFLLSGRRELTAPGSRMVWRWERGS